MPAAQPVVQAAQPADGHRSTVMDQGHFLYLSIPGIEWRRAQAEGNMKMSAQREEASAQAKMPPALSGFADAATSDAGSKSDAARKAVRIADLEKELDREREKVRVQEKQYVRQEKLYVQLHKAQTQVHSAAIQQMNRTAVQRLSEAKELFEAGLISGDMFYEKQQSVLQGI